MAEPYELTACDALDAMRAGQLSARELVDSCLSRIATEEPVIGAWTYLNDAAARAQASALDEAAAKPATKDRALFGLPMGIKDLIDTADMPTEYGCPAIFQDWQPIADASCVALSREAGALILGKTVTQAFGCGQPVRTANPRNPQHTSGGSSAGSAAAVAAGMVPLAIGSQSASSLIRPASYNGIVGMRPSMHNLNNAGFKYFNGSFDTLGLLGRNVDDVALLWSVMAGTRFDRGATQSRAPRIAICRPAWLSTADATARRTIDDAARRLDAAGADIREITLPAEFGQLVEAHIRIQSFEAARSYAWEYQHHKAQLDDAVVQLIEAGRGMSYEAYLRWDTLAHAVRAKFPALLADADCVLTAAAPGEAPQGWHALGDAFSSMGNPDQSRAWTLLHLPVVTVPCSKGPQGLPVGVQLIGGYRSDQALLETSRWVESALACE